MARKVPKTIMDFGNDDKLIQESWNDPGRARDLAKFPIPFRMLIIAGPGAGKTNLCKNLVAHILPDELYVIHEDADSTAEWDDADPTEILPDAPPLDFWTELRDRDLKDGKPKRRLAVIDDLEFTGSKKKDREKNIAILMRYASTHCSLGVILCHQSFFDLPPLVKKMSNVFVIFKPRARTEMTTIEDRIGLPKGDLADLFNTIATRPRDSICADFTVGTPAPLRLNIWTPLHTQRYGDLADASSSTINNRDDVSDNDGY